MDGWPDDPNARAARLAPYFGLQLAFARAYADRAGLSLVDAVARVTNLQRRLGLAPEFGGDWEPVWRDLLDRLAAAADPTEVVCEAYAAHLPERAPPAQTVFGCFKYEGPDADGVVRLHFNNAEIGQDISPLHERRVGARRGELTKLFAHVREHRPQARSVSGGSWLYNLVAYRRLFPPAYTDSRHVPEGPVRLTGTSSWGQFLDHREQLKPGPAQALVARIDALDPEAPWTAFPLRALRTAAPVAEFHEFYG